MDLAPFTLIDPCGYPGLHTIDLARLGVTWSWSETAAVLNERLAAHLSRQTVTA
jgi:lipoyl(octanoyl) transferase